MNNTVSVKKAIAFGFLKLVIEYQGRKYAILRHVRCHGDPNDLVPAAPPYVTKTIETNWPYTISREDLPSFVAEARMSAAEQLQELKKRMVALCHQLGFQSFRLDIAPTLPTDHFCSRHSGIVGVPVIYTLQAQSKFTQYALADAFGRRGFIFAPLEYAHNDHERIPAYPNVQKMLRTWASARPLATLLDSDFAFRCSGWVCSLDVSGYGELLHTSHGSVTAPRTFVQNTVRREVVRLTSRLLWRLRSPPYQPTGDGAIFCVPDHGITLRDICEAYVEEVCKPLECWNQLIRTGESSGSEAGSRLVVVHDEFHCGRIAGADSIATGVDGQALIDVVRLDSGFKQHLQSGTLLREARHYLVSPEALLHVDLGLGEPNETFQYATKEHCYLRGRFSPIVFQFEA